MKLLALASLMLSSFWLNAQNFTFSPDDTHTATLAMDVYSEHQIDVLHDLPDSAYISWRAMVEDYPEEWDVQLCDWQHCYTYLPANGDMLAVPAGGSGYIRLLVNPMNVPASGYLMFWIFPTGQMEEHVEIHFYLNTVITNVTNDLSNVATTLYCDAEVDVLYAKNASFGLMRLYSITGTLVKQYNIQSEVQMEDVSMLPAGIYVAITSDGKRFRFFV